MRDLKVLLEVIPYIEAEESLLVVQQYAVGAGTMKPEAQQRVLQSWQSLMGGTIPRKRSTPKDMIAFAQAIAGVKVSNGR